MSEVVNIPQLRFPEFETDWEKEKLKNVSTYFNGGSFENDVQVEGRYELVTLKSINMSGSLVHSKRFIEIEVSTLSKNTLVMILSEQSPGLLGMTALIPIDNKYVLNQRVAEIRPNDNVDSYFLSMSINRNQRYFGKHGAGTKVQNLSKPNVENYEFLCPTKPEQQKIAAFLTAVDTKIEQLSNKKALLGEYKKGLMQQIFSQAIRFKADDGSAFPVWEEKNIVELAKTSIGLVTSMTPYYVDKGVPLIRNNDIFQNKIRKEKLIRLDYEFDQLNKNRRLFTNDIVTVHTGNIGASAVIDEELNGCQGFATLNTRIKNQNEISSSFLCWYYNSTRNIKYALSMATGDGRSNYNLKDFNKATIPVPSLPEQTKIAAFLTAADNKIEQVGKQFDESKQFKKALLQQMFV